jgi:tyrosinase
MSQHGRTYLPPQSAPSSLKGHRIDDTMASLISAPMKPSEVLDMTSAYVYDSIAV